MAASSSALDPMTGARAGGFFFGSKAVDTFEGDLSPLGDRMRQALHDLASKQDPQAEVDTSQESEQSWFNGASNFLHFTSTPLNFQILPVTERSDFRDDRLQGTLDEKRIFDASVDTASRHECQQNVGHSLLSNDRQRVLLTFPEGEDDAVTITERDMEGLQPPEYLSNNIIDFYIKYLERRLSSEDRERFYFFNSFFFTKLLGNSSASNDIDDCKVDYERVRKWSGEVNLFEKDYIFIPVLRRSHWSLIIICHLSSLSSSSDTRKGSPCILHLDSFEGKHENFKRQVRSYISKAWMEKYHTPNNTDQLLDLCQMKYVQAEVPKQVNGYDCGLYLLHYVEVFLVQSTSPDFSFAAKKGVPFFPSSHFAQDVCGKRMAIRELILRISQEQSVKSMDAGNLSQEHRMWLDGNIMSGGRNIDSGLHNEAEGGESKHEVHPSTGVIGALDNTHVSQTAHTHHPTTWESRVESKPLNGVETSHGEYQSSGEVTEARKQQSKKQLCAALLEPSKATNKRKWTEEENFILLNCMVEGGRFSKENETGTRWDIISQEIDNKLGTMLTGDQCRRRYDTLLKAFRTSKKFCMKNGKSFSEITKAERVELRLATTLKEEWYGAIDEICGRLPHKGRSQKRVKVSPGDENGLLVLSPSHAAPLTPPAPVCAATPAPVPAPPISAPAPILTGSSKPGNSPQRQVAIPGFSSLDGDLRFTLLNLIQASLMGTTMSTWTSWHRNLNFKLEEVCQWLAIVQDRKSSDIRKFIFKLSALKLVNFGYMDFGYNDISENETLCLDLSNLPVHKKILKKVLCKNPDFNICLDVNYNSESAFIPNVLLDPLSLQGIRVLNLYECQDVECADLSNFPELRVLSIWGCRKLRAVKGWEVVKKLGWLELISYIADFPRVECLPSLREFRFTNFWEFFPPILVPDFRQCVRLRTLEISNNGSLNSMDLSTLRFLEVLKFCMCSALTTIQGLSGLHSLTKLELLRCEAVRGVPELGCLKALTHLDLSGSGVEEIAGVEELHLLTLLYLFDCRSLKRLPWLGHLKALADLGISGSGVEIPGVEDLVSLEWLGCGGSRLKRLPDLHHLRRLRDVWITETPLSRDSEPSSFYYGKGGIKYNAEEGRMGDVDEISDVSDSD